MTVAYDVIVPAGGAARRLGGVDKPAVVVTGRSLLDHVLDAVSTASRVIVVGPERAGRSQFVWCREQPPGGGPVAALAAGIVHVSAPVCLVLAADLPRVAPAVPVLLESLTRSAAADAALLVTDERPNLLAAAWSTASLRAALEQVRPDGAAVRSLYAGREIVEVSDADGWGRDCDTWDDIADAAVSGLRA